MLYFLKIKKLINNIDYEELISRMKNKFGKNVPLIFNFEYI